jgi:putative membrane protein
MRRSFNYQSKLSFTGLLVRWAVLALGVTLATRLVDGISYERPGDLVAVVVLLSLFNAVLKPLLLLFTLPFIVLTMGLGVVVINALLFLWVGKLVAGFHVDGFWPALWGALIVSVTNLVISALMRGSSGPRPPRGGPPPTAGTGVGKGGDVIDI